MRAKAPSSITDGNASAPPANPTTGAGAPGTIARGHNWILRRLTDGKLDYVQVSSSVDGAGAATGSPPYRTSDFADLFRPPQPA